MRMESVVALLGATLVLCAARPADNARRARMLDQWALEIVDRPDATVEDRHRALAFIEEALALEPDSSGHWFVLGRLRDQQEEDQAARSAYRRAIALAPAQPEPHLRLGRSWKRTWLRTLNREARDLAIAHFDTVTRLRPYGSEGRLQLVPLHYERGDLGRAADAAERALAGRPRVPEALLAAAYMGYRLGDIVLADSLFRVAIPQVSPDLRALMEDPLRLMRTPVKSDAMDEDISPDTLGGRDSAMVAALQRPPIPSAALPFSAPPGAADTASLAELDPDPTTPQNEVQLECWSRIAHAYLLLYEPTSPGFDARAETYVRYGPPASVLLNPPGVPLFLRIGKSEYPLDAQLWFYPELGMQILLH